jgi:hypothetical protein
MLKSAQKSHLIGYVHQLHLLLLLLLVLLLLLNVGFAAGGQATLAPRLAQPLTGVTEGRRQRILEAGEGPGFCEVVF